MAEDGDLDRNEFIQLNLISLVNCTVLNVEVVNHLVQKGLITTSEEDYFVSSIFEIPYTYTAKFKSQIVSVTKNIAKCHRKYRCIKYLILSPSNTFVSP